MIQLLAALVFAAAPVRAQFFEPLGKGMQGLWGASDQQAPVPEVTETRDATPPEDEGPAAALAYERALRGVRNPAPKHPYYYHPKKDHAYPGATPPPPAGFKNLAKMTPELWSPEQLTRDFQAKKTAEQAAILVMVKTEFCHSNEWRLCSVTTAALEKRSTPLLRKFKTYYAWVKGNPDQEGPQWEAWEKQVIDAYQFDQGPGAKLVVVVPGRGIVAETNALKMNLVVQSLEANGGRTPELEAWLQGVLTSMQPQGIGK